MMKLEKLNQPPKILKYPGYNGVESCCGIRRFGDTVIATELAENTGTHLSEAIEIVATLIVEKFGITPENLKLIEEIPDRTPMFSLITLTPGDSYMHIQRVKFVDASWSPLLDKDVETIISQSN